MDVSVLLKTGSRIRALKAANEFLDSLSTKLSRYLSPQIYTRASSANTFAPSCGRRRRPWMNASGRPRPQTYPQGQSNFGRTATGCRRRTPRRSSPTQALLALGRWPRVLEEMERIMKSNLIYQSRGVSRGGLLLVCHVLFSRRYMTRSVATVLWIGCLVFTSAAFSAEKDSVRLDKVSIHLFLENSGVLSDDVTSVGDFSTWNSSPLGTLFSPDDRFNSFLIKVWLSSDRETFQAGEQGRVVVKSEKTGKVLFESGIKQVYIPKDGRTVVPVLYSGYHCDPLVVEVRSSAKTITKKLPFKCGE